MQIFKMVQIFCVFTLTNRKKAQKINILVASNKLHLIWKIEKGKTKEDKKGRERGLNPQQFRTANKGVIFIV